MVALAIGLWGVMRTQADFSRYSATEQSIVLNVEELYAQSLQGSQALRNFVLNPAHPRALGNVHAADQAYAHTYEETWALVQHMPQAETVQALAPLRANLMQVQQEVLALVQKGDLAAARAMLIQKETSTWSKLRAALLEQRTSWREVAVQVQAQAQAAASRTWQLAMALALVAVGVTVGMLTVLVRTLHRELGGEPAQVRHTLRRVAEGQLDATLPPSDNVQQAPQGLMAELHHMQAGLRDLVQQVQTATQAIMQAADEIAQGNQNLSHRTESQASALQETTVTMEQLSANVRSNADSAAKANQMAHQASKVAAEGGSVVHSVVETMKGIDTSSRRIGDIIGVIDGIAFQTNILALNAAVEAARAGEQGRGFAVVASEVRSLAKRSAEAAREIKALIDDSVQRVGQGSQLVNQAGATMSEIVIAIERVTRIMNEISTASSEQSQDVLHVGEAIAQMDHATQQNAALVEQSAGAALALRQQTQGLMQAVSRFHMQRVAAVGHAH